MQFATQSRGVKPSLTPSTAGLILLDTQNQVLYHNPEAAKILTFPGQGKKSATNFLPNELQSMLHTSNSSRLPKSAVDFRSGKRRYACRVFVLAHNSGKPAQAMTGILLERVAPKSVDIADVAQQFRLTQREQETVGLLTLGLTSKEIASRMNISPNTVKAFFRLVMTKMSVSTRAGIVGKIARVQPLG
jgi:DNA-binding CsgD family transcriptional regulator